MILTISGGSSSVKFAFFKPGDIPEQFLGGAKENIGTKTATLRYHTSATTQQYCFYTGNGERGHATSYLINWLTKLEDFELINAISHRIINGMMHTKPEIITDDVLCELKNISTIYPEHSPEEIKITEVFKTNYPDLKQIACFDTSFHTSMPAVAKFLSTPHRHHTLCIQRYDFHGISYAYLVQEGERIAGEETAKSKVILAHLENGVSLAAINNGKSINTSAGFTPTTGVMTGTCTGDHPPEARSKICDGLEFPGIELDEIKNMKNDAVISTEINTVQALLSLQMKN